MKTASRITLVLGAVAALLAIWQPAGAWWQWALTALLLLLAGAGLSGPAAPGKTAPGDEAHERSGEGTTLEQIDADVAEYKRTYGRKADR